MNSIHDSGSVLSKRLTKNAVCGTCSQTFVVRDPLHIRGYRCPILLHCGHSACELCVRHNMQPESGMTCGVCNVVTYPKTDTITEMLDEFYPNMYLMGNMTCAHSTKVSLDITKQTFLPAGASMYKKSSQDSRDSVSLCTECAIAYSTWSCHQCAADFCKSCWVKVHKAARSLMKHEKQDLNCAKKMKKFEALPCPEHESQKLEFYCKSCDTAICPHCLLLLHQGEGHSAVTMKDRNQDSLGAVSEAIEEAALVLAQMRHSLKKVKSKHNVRHDTSKLLSVEQQICRQFLYAHGTLQLMEERLLQELADARMRQENCLEIAALELERHISNVDELIAEANLAVNPSNLGVANLQEIVSRLKKTQDLPCILLPPEKTEFLPKISFNEEVVNNLSTFCSMTIPTGNTYELRSRDDLPEDFVLEPMELDDVSRENLTCNIALTKILAAGEKCLTVHKRSQSNASASGTLSPQPSLSSLSTSQSEPKASRNNLAEGIANPVFVAYIKDPGEFYVVLNSDRTMHKNLEKKGKEFVAVSGAPKRLSKDDLYLVQYLKNKTWYRGRVVDVEIDANDGSTSALVYYIDYGNTEIVPLDRIRIMPERMKEEPPLAMKCRLFDCLPRNKKWCKESTQTMINILNDSVVTMYVMRVLPDCLEVDLSKTSQDDRIGNDILSLRDSLLFLEYAMLVGGPKKKRLTDKQSAAFLPQILPADRDDLSVIVLNVVSLSQFYVCKAGVTHEYLIAMLKEMNNYYKSNHNKGIIYNPLIGMVCAAQYTADKSWYRAQIINLPGRRNVLVRYVDFGNQEIISWHCIRKLKESFLKLPPQALQCSLADIRPAKPSGWTLTSKRYFEKMVAEKSLRMFIQSRNRDGLQVLLYESYEKREICINAVFVQKGFATEIESNSPALEYLREVVENQQENLNHARGRRGSNGFRKEDPKRPKRKVFEESHEDSDSSEDVGEDSDLFPPNDGIVRIRVSILSVQTPSLLYVCLAYMESKLKEMQVALVEFYKDSEPEGDEKWEVDDKCVVFNPETEMFYRAVVFEFLDGDRVKVFLKDFARVEIVSIGNLRKMDDNFVTLPWGALKCHFARIRPADGKNWPSLSIEYLATEIEKYRVFFAAKVGMIENHSLPIELWVRREIDGGALEPVVSEWVTFNQMLVDQGLAIPVKVDLPEYVNDSEVIPPAVMCVDSDERIRLSTLDLLNPKLQQDDVSSESDCVIENGFIATSLSDWIPPAPLVKSRFVCVPTYVDQECNVYLNDDERDGRTLCFINEELGRMYGKSRPAASYDVFWEPGQLCIARYHGDNRWYRGKVLEVKNESGGYKYEVLFVDYGNVETCEFSDLRKHIKMSEIPILSHKCRLTGIVSTTPDGTWPVPVIDYIHGLLVDKKCYCEVLEDQTSSDEPVKIKLSIKNGRIDPEKLLVDLKHAVYVEKKPIIADSQNDDPDVIIEDEPATKEVKEVTVTVKKAVEPELTTPLETEVEVSENGLKSAEKIVGPEEKTVESGECHAIVEAEEKTQKKSLKPAAIFCPSFEQLDIPVTCNLFPVESATIQSFTEFTARLSYDKSLPEALKNSLKKLQKISEDLQKHGKNQPKLEEFFEGQPCCCIYEDDSNWYRAKIEKVVTKNENEVRVEFVDYGNKQYIPKNELRECKEEWLELPRMSLLFKLFNVEKAPNVDRLTYLEALVPCLAEDICINIVMRHEKFYEVEVMSSEGGCALAYQSMLDSGLMKYIIDPEGSDLEDADINDDEDT